MVPTHFIFCLLNTGIFVKKYITCYTGSKENVEKIQLWLGLVIIE